MTVYEMLSRAYAYAVTNPETVALIFTTIFAIYRAISERMTLKASLFLLANTLKDEDKMTPAGQFRTETVAKAKEIAKLSLAGEKASVEVEKVISEFNSKAGKGVKIGSYKGKPLYLEDIGRLGLLAKTARDVFKNIFRR